MAMANVVHLDPVVPAGGAVPDDIGTGHRMREVTETVAVDAGNWTGALAGEVRGFFDSIADEWSSDLAGPLNDALDRGLTHFGLSEGDGVLSGPVLELGAGTGAGTRILNESGFPTVAGDLSFEMLARLPRRWAARVQLDAASLPFPDGCTGIVVCVNMLLFADELRRVLRPGGVLVWVNGIGERTPIHLSAEALAEALGDGTEVVASRSGWGTWAVARPL